jgi:hypothetical protein
MGSFVYQHNFPEPFIDILERCISKEPAEGLWPSSKYSSCVSAQSRYGPAAVFGKDCALRQPVEGQNQHVEGLVY